MTDRILIIEDDDEIASLVGIHLRDLGYQITRAEDGKTGLDQALTDDYLLIILDLMLPESSPTIYSTHRMRRASPCGTTTAPSLTATSPT